AVVVGHVRADGRAGAALGRVPGAVAVRVERVVDLAVAVVVHAVVALGRHAGPRAGRADAGVAGRTRDRAGLRQRALAALAVLDRARDVDGEVAAAGEPAVDEEVVRAG